MPAKKSEGSPVAASIRIVRPGVHIEGSYTELIRSSGEGQHLGWAIEEGERGVTLRKEGLASKLIPWSMVREVEYEP